MELNAHALAMDGRVWPASNGLNRNNYFENDGLRNGKKCKICLATKNGDALEQNLWKWYAPKRNLELKMGVSRAVHT